MVVGRSDLLQSPSELMLGKGGIDLLLQGRAAHNMSDEISPLDVVWDDGLMHGLDCREELEQQEVLFDECLNVDSTVAVDLLTLLTHGNETFLKEVDMEAANNLFSSMQHEVVWDEEMPSDIGTHEIVVLTPVRTSGLLKQGINIADQVFGDGPSKVVVWDEELFHDLDSNDGLLQQLAQSGDYFDENKSNDLVSDYGSLDDNLLHDQFGTHSYPYEASETSSGKTVGHRLDITRCNHPIINSSNDQKIIADTSMLLNSHSELDSDYLDTYEELLQQLALNSDYLIKENTKPIVVWEVDELLELKVIDGDKYNVNLQLGLHEADFGMMLPSTESGCVADHFSPQCPKQHDKDNLFFVLYEACVGQEMNCDHQNLVIFEERQEKGSAQYVITETPSWRLNAFSTLNRDMEVDHLVFDNISSWRRTGFSPRSSELKRTLSGIFNTQLSDQAFKSELFLDAYLLDVEYQGCISVWQCDPGIWSYLIMGLSLRISEISVLIQFIQKFSAIFSLQLLPGTVSMKGDPELDDCGIASSMWELTTMLMISLQKHSPHGKQEPSIQYKFQEGNGFYTNLIIPPNQLSEGVAVWLTFPIAVDSMFEQMDTKRMGAELYKCNIVAGVLEHVLPLKIWQHFLVSGNDTTKQVAELITNNLLAHVDDTSQTLEICVLEKIPSWRGNGFSPGRCEQTSYLSGTPLQLADKAMKFEFSSATYLKAIEYRSLRISFRIWDPGIQKSRLNDAPHDCLHTQLVQIIWHTENTQRHACCARHDVA